MNFLFFFFSLITYKRFLLAWAFLGLLVTHSWLTEPWNPEIGHVVTKLFLFFFGACAFFCYLTSHTLNRFQNYHKLTRYELLMLMYLFMALFSSIINTGSIGIYPILQLAIPILFGLSFTYLFTEMDLKKVLLSVSLYGILNLLFTFAIFVVEGMGNITSFPISALITDRNGCAKYLAIVNAFILIEFIIETQNNRRIVLGTILALIFAGILILYSRSGYIVYLISSSLILLMSNSKKIKFLFLVCLPVIVIIFSIFTINRMHAEKMNVANSSDLGRVYVGKAGINMIKAHPITGVGYRMSEPQIQKFADRKLPGLPNLITIHNWYIVVWAEMGIIGFLLFSFLNLSLIINNFKKVKKIGFEKGKYALFSVAALLIFLFDAQVLPNYDYESIYWIIVAISIISLKKLPESESVV